MYRIAILGMLLMFLFTVGCKDNSVVEEPNVSVKKEFRIIPWEVLDGNNRAFQINIETILTESCENTVIDVLPSFGNNDISLSIRNIPTPDCIAPIFPATSKNMIGDLQLPNYDIEISLKDVIHNNGELFVEEEYYEIKMENLDGIVIPDTRLYKVPENTIWGYVAYSENTHETIANDFVDEIESVTTTKDFEDGFYGYFSIENSKPTILNEDITHSIDNAFGLSFSGDNVLLTDILSNYRTQHPDLVFKIFTSKGEEL